MLQGMLDLRNEPLARHPNPQSLVLKAVGDDAAHTFTGNGIVMRTGQMAITFFPRHEGFYQATVYAHDEPITAPFELYIGTSELRQQTAAGGRLVHVPLDGAHVALMPLTDHAGQRVPYSVDDVRVHLVSSDGVVTPGAAEVRDDGSLVLHLTPPARGSYVAQAYLGERPILARVLQLSVDE